MIGMVPNGDELEKILLGMRQNALNRQHLTDMEKSVLRLRFGLDSEKAKTQTETARELEICRERVRQIEARALRKLRLWYHHENMEELAEVIASI